jgi:hypothetical protein
MGALAIVGGASQASARSIVGDWATNSSIGELVSTSGSYQTTYNGEALHFRKDGTFLYVIAASGSLMNGVSVEKGRYSAHGNRLVLKCETEDWTPNVRYARQRPAYKNKHVNNVYTYDAHFTDADTLKLVEVRLKITTVMHRVGKAQ